MKLRHHIEGPESAPVIVLANVLDGGVWARMRDELDLLWE